MYFSGNLAVDPSQLTKIELKEPEGFFKRLMFFIFKANGEKIEVETFTALTILQELKNVFQSAKINNIVRLSQDDVDFYFDTQGIDNDFETALEQYDLDVNEAYASRFNVLHLIMEHSAGSFKYLIDIKISRNHKVGKYPIEINVNGLLKDFQAQEGGEELVKTKMEQIFKSQQLYDSYLREKQLEFDLFLRKLEQDIRTNIRIDDVTMDSQQKMIVPKEQVPKRSKDISPRPTGSTVFHGYYGFGDMLWYSMIWGSMCHDNHIHVHNVDLVTDSGDMVGSLGDEGFDAGESTIFDDDVSFDDRMSDNFEGMDGMDGMDGGDFGDMGDIGDAGGDWFDFDGGGFDFGGFDF